MNVHDESPMPAALPPALEWIPVEPPWSMPAAGARSADPGDGRGMPPVPPGGAAGGPFGPWGPPPAPPGPPPPQPSKPIRAGLAVTVALALMTAFVGLGVGIGIGTQLHRGSVSSTGVASPSPAGGSVSSPAPSGTGNSTQAAAIAAKVDPAIVDINTKLGYQNAAAAGTGMVLASTGEILTNNHVVDGATSITATVVSTGRRYSATLVGTDPTADIAVIQLQGASGLKTIQTGSSAVAVGDSVVALGNASGAGGTPAVVTATVQALNQTITASDQNGANAERLSHLIQTDAPLQPGDSGGPLVNTAGQVIGIDTAASGGDRFNSAASVGFAVPIGDGVSIAKQIGSGHATATIHIGLPAFLGVAILPDGASSSGTQSAGGAVVGGVASGSPASAAGLAQGDTITAVSSQPVASAQALTSLLRSHHPGDKIAVSWTDQGGASHTATVALATGPAD